MSDDEVGDPALRAELLAMMEADQAERRSEPWEQWHDRERAARLAEVIDESGGWPDPARVGRDGVFVAWLIAQHADHDVAFQQRALALVRTAVAAGRAEARNLAYLEDRVLVNTGRPQLYGTQVTEVDGRLEAATLSEPDTVDERRAALGMESLADYLAYVREVNAQGHP